MAFARSLPELPEPGKLYTVSEVPLILTHFDSFHPSGWWVKLLLRSTHGPLRYTRLLLLMREHVEDMQQSCVCVLAANREIIAVVWHTAREPQGYYQDWTYRNLLWERIRWYHGCFTGWLFMLTGFRWRIRHL